MELKETADCLAELGNETRLKIFRFLVQSGRKSIPVGHLQKELDIPASTLSHHISRLTRVGLITQIRQGRELLCHPEFEKLQNLLGFLVDECCKGEDECFDLNKKQTSSC